ncbi:MAG: HDOD domain-containing protein [Methylococcaceae bacterium]
MRQKPITLAIIQDATSEVTCLFSLPEIYLRIPELMDNAHSGLDNFSKIVSADPNLTASILKIVNSAYFDCIGHIAYIHQTLNLLAIGLLHEIGHLVFDFRYQKYSLQVESAFCLAYTITQAEGGAAPRNVVSPLTCELSNLNKTDLEPIRTETQQTVLEVFPILWPFVEPPYKTDLVQQESPLGEDS